MQHEKLFIFGASQDHHVDPGLLQHFNIIIALASLSLSEISM